MWRLIIFFLARKQLVCTCERLTRVISRPTWICSCLNTRQKWKTVIENSRILPTPYVLATFVCRLLCVTDSQNHFFSIWDWIRLQVALSAPFKWPRTLSSFFPGRLRCNEFAIFFFINVDLLCTHHSNTAHSPHTTRTCREVIDEKF